MQDTCSNSSFVFLLIIDVEVAKTTTSFLTFWGTYWYNDLFVCRCNI